MRHVMGDGSVANRRSDRTRILALIATFLLLMAGIVVSTPGLLTTASATGTTSTSGDDGDHDDDDDDGDECKNDDDDGDHDDDDRDDDETSTTVDDDDDDDGDGDETSTSVDDDDGDHDDDDGDHDDETSTSVDDDDDGDDGDDETSTSVDDDGDDNETSTTADENDDSASEKSNQGGDDGDGDETSTSVDDDGDDDGDETSTSVDDDGDDDGDETSTSVDDADQEDDGDHEDDDDGDDETSTTVQDHDDDDGDDDGDDEGDDDENCDATLTLYKNPGIDNGGNLLPEDFQLLLDGEPQAQEVELTVAADVEHIVSEVDQPGYELRIIICTDGDTNERLSENGKVTLEAGQRASCEVVNDDIAPTVTLHKVVASGETPPGDFILTINDEPVAQGTALPVVANEPLVISEDPTPGYAPASVACTSDLEGSPNQYEAVGTATIEITPALAEDIVCTITNDAVDVSTITVVKDVDNTWGGTLTPADFQLFIDQVGAVQGLAHEVAAGGHTISELDRPGYLQSDIVCVDLATEAVLTDVDGAITVDAGQDVECTVFNVAMAATLTLIKAVINTDGGLAVAGDFVLMIDGVIVAQRAPVPVKAGKRIITEVPVDDYRLIDIRCSDNDDPQAVVVYSGGVTLALGQNVTCFVVNDDDPIDLFITKSDNGAVPVAGGPAFNYTITVDNLGPRNASLGEDVTVTDQLPVGFVFGSPLPGGCTAVGQTLTCVIDPATLEVGDPAVVLTVPVMALPGAASGVYTNLAFVDTPEDPACVGAGCMPVCSDTTNNVACDTTVVTRAAMLAIDKQDDVTGPIRPGQTFSYNIQITNTGPSTFLTNLVMTDDLPAALIFQSVTAASPWSCPQADPVVCTYGIELQPGALVAPVIKITVRLDPNFTGTSVDNTASVTAVVEAPAVVESSQSAVLAVAPSGPGTVVTATDDETTPIVRVADLSIDKSVSVGTTVVGGEFNWVLDITNHGPDLATNLTVSDSIPSQFEVLGAFPTAGLSCTNTTSSVQCTAASLAVNATVRVIVQVRVVASAAPGTVTNTGSVTATSTDPDPTDNSDSASIDITAAASQAPVPVPASGSAAPTPTLPRTGGSPVGPLTLAALLFCGGMVSLVIARRRRAMTA